MTLVKNILWPLTLPYGAGAHLRARAYRTGVLNQRRLDGFVISVGNLTTGGTGKTPMVLWLAHRVLAEDKKVGILTRGYRGQRDPSGPTSDEVRLLRARLGDRVAFGVGADRFVQGQQLVKQGVEWFILDDGFQHMQLARDVDIVLVDATNPFGGGNLLPAGRLREPQSALRRADIIVITRRDHAPAVEAAVRRNSDAPVFYARGHLESIASFRGDYPGTEAPQAHQRKLFAFSGIGNPDAYRIGLREWGFNVVGHKVFRDHHRYTARDMREVEAEARQAGANGLICTEKDIFNLEGVPLPEIDLYYCRITLRVGRGDEFWEIILTAAKSRVESGK